MPWQSSLPAAPTTLQVAPGQLQNGVRVQPSPPGSPPRVLCGASIKGRSAAYACRQAAVREQIDERTVLRAAAELGDADAAAALAALPAPAADYDDDATREARYAELRADDMRRLAAAVSNMLQLACRFRGMVSRA